nr:nitroreductase family protein [uncultured Clostridium sp.]
MNINACIKSRRSSLSFLPEYLSEDSIKSIVKSGSYSPIFGNTHFTVIENKEFMDNLNTTTINMMKASNDEFAMKMANTPGYSPIYNAPSAIVLSALNGNDSNGFNMVNVACAAENMLLTATELGIASRFVMAPIMAFMNPELCKSAGIPEGYVPLCMVLLGKTEEPFAERNRETNNVNFIK